MIIGEGRLSRSWGMVAINQQQPTDCQAPLRPAIETCCPANLQSHHSFVSDNPRGESLLPGKPSRVYLQCTGYIESMPMAWEIYCATSYLCFRIHRVGSISLNASLPTLSG